MSTGISGEDARQMSKISLAVPKKIPDIQKTILNIFNDYIMAKEPATTSSKKQASVWATAVLSVLV